VGAPMLQRLQAALGRQPNHAPVPRWSEVSSKRGGKLLAQHLLLDGGDHEEVVSRDFTSASTLFGW